MRISPFDPLAALAKPARIEARSSKPTLPVSCGKCSACTQGPYGWVWCESPVQPEDQPPHPVSQIQTPSQRRGEHWRTRADRAKAQRSKMRRDASVWLDSNGPVLQITVTRVAPRRLDEPNLGQALKHAIDGLSDALRIDDGSRAVRWVLQQRKGPAAVEFTIEAIP